MKAYIRFLSALILASLVLSSCSSSMLVSSGSRDNKPLLFNGEYQTKDLNELQIEGAAVFGIPTKSNNNKSSNTGFIFTFNGIELGRTRRILPIMSLIGYSFFSQTAVQKLIGEKTKRVGLKDIKTGEYRVGFATSYILGLPIAGMLNNLTWSNAAVSGASATLQHRLISENPDVDVFFYPKYEVSQNSKLFTQDAILKARVSGATLIHK
jgi:hypothetical protein